MKENEKITLTYEMINLTIGYEGQMSIEGLDSIEDLIKLFEMCLVCMVKSTAQVIFKPETPTSVIRMMFEMYVEQALSKYKPNYEKVEQ